MQNINRVNDIMSTKNTKTCLNIMQGTNAPFYIAFSIHGQPVAKARPRTVRARNGRVRTYTPAKTSQYEKAGQWYALAAMKGQDPFSGPLTMQAQIHLAVPKSWSQKKKADALNGTLLPLKRPDIDNYIKAILDCCNEVVFRDDSQVVGLAVTKHYSAWPRVDVQFSDAHSEDMQAIAKNKGQNFIGSCSKIISAHNGL